MSVAAVIGGVVLTGGASRRMGVDKALIEVGGVALAVRVTQAGGSAGCAPVWCQGGDRPALARLGLTVRPDRTPGEGPLAAIVDAYAGLAELAPDATGMVVAACDLPDLAPGPIRGLVAARRSDRPAALATAGSAHLVSWWPIGLRDAVFAHCAAGMRSYREALAVLDATLVDVAPETIRNVNRPSDL